MNLKVSVVSNLFNPVSPDAPGGLEIFNYFLCRELDKNGVDVKLYASGDSYKSAYLKPLIEKSIQFSQTDEYLKNPWNYRKMTMEEFACFLKFDQQMESDPGIIHFSTDNFLPIYLAVKKNLPIVTTLHLPTGNYPYQALINLLTEKEIERVHFIGVSNDQVKDFPYVYKVIHNGVDLNDFPYSADYEDSYLWLGRMTGQKGCADAIAAAKKALVNLKIGAPLKLDTEFGYFNKNIKSELNNNIKYLGHISTEQRAKFYQGKALLFTPKNREAFGLTLIESMACGTPVIAYRRGAAGEVVIDGKNGYLVAEDDVGGIEEAIKKIESLDEDKYLEMRKFCRQHVEQNFSLGRMVNEYISTYEEILKMEKYETIN